MSKDVASCIEEVSANYLTASRGGKPDKEARRAAKLSRESWALSIAKKYDSYRGYHAYISSSDAKPTRVDVQDMLDFMKPLLPWLVKLLTPNPVLYILAQIIISALFKYYQESKA